TFKSFISHRHKHRQGSVKWTILSMSIALLICIPILTIAVALFSPSGELWEHLVDTVLSNYIKNSFVLILGVSAGVLLIGVSSAWLVTMCEFPGRKIFEWASV